jgi:surface polysaccharide O-acyltransferase-like enzyme
MKREPNFEVMRTITMFFIVIYHCLTHGIGDGYKFSIAHPISLANIVFSDFLLVFSSISVNLYIMVSGYFLTDLDFKFSRIVRTWVIACFYSCAITLLLMSLSIIPFSFTTLGKSFFPISTDAYWFVTQYIGLLILSPFLSILARLLSYRQYIILLIGGAFICLSIIPDFPLGKRYHVAHGNSVWSFAYLFMVAGFIKHHLQKLPTGKLAFSIVILTLLTMACEIFFGKQNGHIHLFWFNYNGLPFLLAVLVFIFIKQVHIPDNGSWNMLVKFAPYTFGVYLIHDHLLIRGWFWKFVSLSTQCNSMMFPVIILGLCCILFITCAFIDAIRKKVFELLHIDSSIANLDKMNVFFKKEQAP